MKKTDGGNYPGGVLELTIYLEEGLPGLLKELAATPPEELWPAEDTPPGFLQSGPPTPSKCTNGGDA